MQQDTEQTTDAHLRTPAGGPLAGVRVVEVGQAVCAPLCARHLADLGADVIKVEAHDGDLARSYDSVVNGESAYFAWANYGKRSIVLDLRAEDGREALSKLLVRSDVFIHNLGPGSMERLGFGREAVKALNPSIVDCSISGFGSTGPMADRKAFDLLVQGEAGLMSVTGAQDEPAKVGISIVDMCTAVYALSAIQAALWERITTGRGQHIEMSLLDSIAEWMMAPALHQMHTGKPPRREGARHNMMVPYGRYRTGAETSVNFAIQTQRHWQLLCEEVLLAPELTAHADFATNANRVANRRDLEPMIEERLTARGHVSVVEDLLRTGIPCGEVNDLAAFVDHPQLAERSRWRSIRAGEGTTRTIVPPFSLGDRAQDERAEQLAVPALGEHTQSILAALGVPG
ncbi:CaiB/BaiF CoA transferase family protein [Brevibacterium album]|uniref:CaiB/BaiF CoA transferase family protein n=1 Tax=Brevibacterium album TaxID=417948 RepID=UPI001B7FAB7D|nr:CaiB/BaiF CoA-transferase family protein [Brevibacterium album]